MSPAQIATRAGWERKEFAPGVFKWWNPTSDDGARYLDKESSLRHLIEDHGLDVSGSAP